MESTFRKPIAVLIMTLITVTGVCQRSSKPFFAEAGGLTGAGYGVNAMSLPEGKYIPVFFIAHFAKDLIAPEKLMGGQRFMLFFEPQVNAVTLQRPGTDLKAAEFGVNAGIQYLYPLSRKIVLYTLISTGPHFITVHTERQAHGFIFSDNMGVGTYFFLTPTLALNTGMRIRHMSNANTRMPNHGINTVNFLTGISFFIAR